MKEDNATLRDVAVAPDVSSEQRSELERLRAALADMTLLAHAEMGRACEQSEEARLHREEIEALRASLTWRLSLPPRRALVMLRQLVRTAPRAVAGSARRVVRSLRRGWRLQRASLADAGGLIREAVLPAQDVPELSAASPGPAGGLRPSYLFVDISELVLRDARTGIQRVVRNILGHLLESPPEGFEVRPVYGRSGRGYCFAASGGTSADTQWVMPATEQKVEPRAGDIFLGLDLCAHLFPEAGRWLGEFRRAGASVHIVVYDLIPLRYPRFTAPGMPEAFRCWMEIIAKEADGLICISQSVAADVRAWLQENVRSGQWPRIEHFPLGADVEAVAPTFGITAAEQQILTRMGSASSFLMVGTVEPRKGHEQVLRGFEALWSRGAEHLLVIVGKGGWCMDSFIERLQTHPENGRRLLWLGQISDEYLHQLYAAADCLIAASEAEGFGLPLIEAAHRKLPIIARDLAVFREVAGEHAYYFSGQAAADVAFAVTSWVALNTHQLTPGSTGIRWHSWQESAAALASLMTSPARVSALRS